MHFYPHNIGDFNNATRHLTRVERSVYRDAIERYYDTETPLPANDFSRICRILLCVTDDEKSALSNILEEFFTVSDGFYHHDRCDKEIAKYRANSSAKARAGKASAEAKKNRVQHVLNVCATDEQLNKKQELINKKQETRNKDIKTLEHVPDWFNEFWIAYPKKKSKGMAEKSWAKLKPDSYLIGKIIIALEKAKRSNDWAKDGGKFIPHPSTWLNAKGWEDEAYEQIEPVISNHENIAVFKRFLNKGE